MTGTAKSRMLPIRELRKILTDTWAIPVIDQLSMLWLKNGMSEVERAARAVIIQNIRSDG
jgi:hypothetical protein